VTFLSYSATDKTPWIQVDFKKPKLLSGIVTIGGFGSQQWIKKYQVFTSLDGKLYRPYSDVPGSSTPKNFTGNTDSVTPVRQLFNRNITARYIKIYPTEFQGSVLGMRFNILGCAPDVPSKSPIPGQTGVPTQKPIPGQTGVPTQKPIPGQTGIPTQKPIPGQTGVPTQHPFPFQTDVPTLAPNAGKIVYSLFTKRLLITVTAQTQF